MWTAANIRRAAQVEREKAGVLGGIGAARVEQPSRFHHQGGGDLVQSDAAEMGDPTIDGLPLDFLRAGLLLRERRAGEILVGEVVKFGRNPGSSALVAHVHAELCVILCSANPTAGDFALA